MNWDALGTFVELIGATAVVVTLIYLSIQLRQNTKAVRLSSAQAVTEELQAMFSLLAVDQSLAEIFVEAGKSDELSGARRDQFYAFNSNFLWVYENAFLQQKDNAHWIGMTIMMIDYSKAPAFTSYWRDRKHWLSDEFQQHMASEIIPIIQETGVSLPGIY